ncbi:MULTISPECIES: porin, partial [unclassified Mesorhizobium]
DINIGNEFETFVPLGASDYGWQKTAMFSVQLDARTETELGTLRAFLDARLVHGSLVSLDKAYLSLGGLTIGRASTAFDYDFGGEQDVLKINGTQNVVQYTFKGGNGFSATISLDDDGDVISGAGAYDDGIDNAISGADFIPNVSANVQYASGPIALGVYGAYDNDTEEGIIKVLGSYAFSDADKLSLGGYWASGATYVMSRTDFSGYTGFRSSLALQGSWSLQGEYKHTFNEKLAASLGVVYINNVGFADDIVADADFNFWRVGTTIDYKPVPGFLIKTSLNYNKFTGDDADFAVGNDNFNDGFFSGLVRFQRDF